MRYSEINISIAKGFHFSEEPGLPLPSLFLSCGSAVMFLCCPKRQNNVKCNNDQGPIICREGCTGQTGQTTFLKVPCCLRVESMPSSLWVSCCPLAGRQESFSSCCGPSLLYWQPKGGTSWPSGPLGSGAGCGWLPSSV